MHIRTLLYVTCWTVSLMLMTNTLYAAENPCGSTGVRESHSQTIGSLRLISGGTTAVCNDGTIAAGRAARPEHEWWRLGTVQETWTNPLMKVCLVPLHLSDRQYDAWHNIIGILAPYAGNELNYATSYRRDGNLIVKKEVNNYGNLSKYKKITGYIPLGTPIGMAASVVHETNTRTVIRSWMSVGSCAVDTARPPDVVGLDEQEPGVPKGSLVLRTDFLAHRVLEWSACEASKDGKTCSGAEVRLVPLPR